MKICLFTASFLPVIGGVEFALHHLAENFVQMGHAVTVLAGRETRISNEITIPHNYTVRRYRYPPKGIFVNQLLLRLSYEYFVNRFDVLHANFLYFPGYVAVNFKKIAKIPVVSTAHGEDIQVQGDINYGMMLDPNKKRKIRQVLQKSDAVTAICDSIKQDFIHEGTDPGKIFSIPHGTCVDNFRNPSKNVKKMFNIPEDHKVVIAVGRNHPKKRFVDIVETAAIVLPICPRTTFLLVGKATDILNEMIIERGLQNNVITSPPVLGEEYNALYATSDIYVTPSLIEGASLANLDALGAGLPIVASNVQGTRDFVKDGENGLLVDPLNPEKMAEALILLLSNDSVYEKLSAGSRKMGERHDWKYLAKEYVGLYQALIEKK